METIASIVKLIRRCWPTIQQRAGIRAGKRLPIYFARLPKAPRILGASAKTEKSDSAHGVLTGIAYLSPSIESGRNLCAFSSTGCAAACLGHDSGRMIFSESRNARLWKSALYIGARPLFSRLLLAEAAALESRARAAGLIPAIRADGSSDTGIGAALAPLAPRVQWYDYTKDYRRALAAARGALAPNYSACFSWSGELENARRALQILRAGGTVAVVFDTFISRARKAPLPARFLGFPVADGDASEARFLDPRGTVIGLRFKTTRQRAAALESAGSFIVRQRALSRAGYFMEGS